MKSMSSFVPWSHICPRSSIFTNQRGQHLPALLWRCRVGSLETWAHLCATGARRNGLTILHTTPRHGGGLRLSLLRGVLRDRYRHGSRGKVFGSHRVVPSTVSRLTPRLAVVTQAQNIAMSIVTRQGPPGRYLESASCLLTFGSGGEGGIVRNREGGPLVALDGPLPRSWRREMC